MSLTSDPKGTAEGRAMLDLLPGLYFAVLKNTRIEHQDGAGIRCSFEIPMLGKRTKTAPTATGAIMAAIADLSEVLTSIPCDQWPAAWRYLAPPSLLDESGPPKEDGKANVVRTKAGQFTIGATMPVKLKMSLQDIADQQNTSFAEVARQLTNAGFEDFDERTFSEGAPELLSMFLSERSKWQSSDSEQVMVRLDPHLAVRLRSAAKEYGRSASEFCVMCLAYGHALQSQLVEVEKQIDAYRGPATRALAASVGLGAHPALLSSILNGSIAAPKKVLAYLSNIFKVNETVLAEFFKRSYERQAVPAFKAKGGKPQICSSATSWEEAVTLLNLPSDEATELLNLDEKSR